MALDTKSFVVRLRHKHGAVLYAASAQYDIPQPVLAALIGNENNSLNPRATRFEAHLFNGLMVAKEGGKPFWGSWDKRKLKNLSTADLKVLATSYGLGQILGMNLYAAGVDPKNIPDMTPEEQITAIAKRLRGGLGATLPPLEACLRWWNTGRTTGKTHDELMHEKTGGTYALWYISRGTANAKAYADLLEAYPTMSTFQLAMQESRTRK